MPLDPEPKTDGLGRPYPTVEPRDPWAGEYELARAALDNQEPGAIETLESLACQGSILSMLFIADELRIGGWVYVQDFRCAKLWYQEAIGAGSIRALYGLGLGHLHSGEPEQALLLLRLAAEHGYAPAIGALGSLHFKGQQVEKNKAEALKLWRRASALGHVNSEMILTSRQLHGHFGLVGMLEGLRNLVPVALKHARLRAEDPYSDGLA